ncbi:hypothetical protein DVH24_020038 [Malus domestica]|uniref:Uncharacterized protein n=1 Tax=Malus domestica TaxID=3750 RepID=A0A498J875_MALDO|nr:hypothetical protein DVH24_020038 [Malus domestica]
MSTTPPPPSPMASVSTTTTVVHGPSLRLASSPKFQIHMFWRKLRALLKGLWVLAQGAEGRCAWVLGSKDSEFDQVFLGFGLGFGV